ncbi:hypothetical protein SAMN04487977_101510 [Treponema bryantii]|uniref:Uncharacterized protein n=1 Tax=Treponema bryantii TaxID=163 RepID=A0A1H9AY88_9SPIR|nr:hypothetical protein [Treponema bryantii]SEP81579.1 hypothetical protein SAMN04487977_101510 [Treponema bryantii]
MFEKEAEEYATTGYEKKLLTKEQIEVLKCGRYDGFLKGAEFGFNKANEWHYVKDELPELYKDVLVVFPRGDCDVKRLTNHNEWVSRGSWCSITDVIAWKEIVLPELKESE